MKGDDGLVQDEDPPSIGDFSELWEETEAAPKKQKEPRRWSLRRSRKGRNKRTSGNRKGRRDRSSPEVRPVAEGQPAASRSWGEITTKHEDEAIGHLKDSLGNIALASGVKSKRTMADRCRAWRQFVELLWSVGYEIKDIKNLRKEHFTEVVEYRLSCMKRGEISNATVINDLWHWRKLAGALGHPKWLKPKNEDYAIPKREKYKGNRAAALDMNKLAKMRCPFMRLSVEGQELFGFRLEESLKFQPAWADCGGIIRMKGSWCKGGRPRPIEVKTERQRDWLNRAKALCGKGSLIPVGKAYYKHRRDLENELVRVGLESSHCRRHQDFQDLYYKGTGWHCPAAGGPTRRELKKDPLKWRLDVAMRRVIGLLAGHGRIDVINSYLGS